MNILTIGLPDKIGRLFDLLHSQSSSNQIKHSYTKDDAIESIKDNATRWDWIVIQGYDDPEQWKSVLCAVNASASDTPITVLSSHIDGTRLKTPVCSMHNNGNGLSISRCAMQNLLEEEKRPIPNTVDQQPAPMVFEYHSPCR